MKIRSKFKAVYKVVKVGFFEQNSVKFFSECFSRHNPEYVDLAFLLANWKPHWITLCLAERIICLQMTLIQVICNQNP